MRLPLARRRPPVPESPVSFGAWVLRCFAGEGPLAELPFDRLEKQLANAASALCGAIHGQPDILVPLRPFPPNTAEDAAVVARRTADGFRAALADPKHTVIVWPWEHLATLVAWRAVRAGPIDESALALALFQIAGAYAVIHRAQLASALTMWTEVARGVRSPDAPPVELTTLGAELHRLYRTTIHHELPAAAAG